MDGDAVDEVREQSWGRLAALYLLGHVVHASALEIGVIVGVLLTAADPAYFSA